MTKLSSFVAVAPANPFAFPLQDFFPSLAGFGHVGAQLTQGYAVPHLAKNIEHLLFRKHLPAATILLAQPLAELHLDVPDDPERGVLP